MELVSKEWNKVIKSKDVQQQMLVTYTSALVDLLSLPKDTFVLDILYVSLLLSFLLPNLITTP
jgi:hypothetical protein